jgi:hypothetical protein
MQQRIANQKQFLVQGMIGLVLLSGCGATGINPLPANETSVFSGAYTGSYTGVNGERGTIVANIATSGTVAGTFTNSVSNQSGPLAGQVRQDGNFKLFYHLANDAATVYSGTGIVTKSTSGINGTWNITTPNATTLTFGLTTAPQ